MRSPVVPSCACIVASLALASGNPSHAQTNIQAHYADGQVWVRWIPALGLPVTYAIYAKDVPFTSTNQADLIGRLFEYEWTPGAIRIEMSDPTAAWVIPDSAGGTITLGTNDGLFVETVLSSGAKYYAVVAWGDTVATPGVNRTAAAVPFTYDLADPPTCHLQRSLVLPTMDFTVRLYAMWSDGETSLSGGRPDFPVMANRAKNGMPSIFFVHEPIPAPPSPRPAALWLHGGTMGPSDFFPHSQPYIRLEPRNGLLVSHNDDFVRYRLGSVYEHASDSYYFGWSQNHDPFNSLWTMPAAGDTIMNYTQRRLIWVNEWLEANEGVDIHRVSINGFSMGSLGTVALSKAYPHRWGSAGIFCCGFSGPTDSDLMGTVAQALPSNLVNGSGAAVTVRDVFDLHTAVSSMRDLPLIRVWSGKNDLSVTNGWDSIVVREYRSADSLGWGAQLWWDERVHSVGPLAVHWTHGTTQTTQTERDNVSYEERYSANVSFPGFYNHRLDALSADPGDGTTGTGGLGVGDDWGTWGGWHSWGGDIVDLPARWEATFSLIALSGWPVDGCPHDSLTADLAIRKPQLFLPAAGTQLDWQVTSITSGAVLQSGSVTVDVDGVVRIPAIRAARVPDRRRITVFDHALASVRDPGVDASSSTARGGIIRMLRADPNPCRDHARVHFVLDEPRVVEIGIHDVTGRRFVSMSKRSLGAGAHEFSWDGIDDHGELVAPGLYFVRVSTPDATARVPLVRLR